MSQAILYLVLGVVLVLVNTLGVFLVVLQMPGSWVMLLATAGFAWWGWDAQSPAISGLTLLAMLLLAISGEIIETVAGARGARRAGGSKTGAILAVVGAVMGAVVMTFVIPVPIVGTVVGACLGAGAGSIVGDLSRGRTLQQASLAGRGAAVGRLWGTVAKVAVAVMMWTLATAAVVLP